MGFSGGGNHAETIAAVIFATAPTM